jgi:hypothetical protein
MFSLALVHLELAPGTYVGFRLQGNKAEQSQRARQLRTNREDDDPFLRTASLCDRATDCPCHFFARNKAVRIAAFGIHDVFVHPIPSPDITGTAKAALKQVFQRWAGKVHEDYYDDKRA